MRGNEDSERGSFALAVLVCAALHLLADWVPVAGEVAAGVVAGFISGGSMRRGSAAGFLGGLLGDALVGSLLALVALPVLEQLAPWAKIPAIVLVAAYSLKGALLSAVGGALGAWLKGALRASSSFLEAARS